MSASTMPAQTGASMMGVIVLKELRAMLRDGRLYLLGPAVLLALCALLLSSANTHLHQQDGRQSVDAQTRAQWAQQGDKNPHRGAHFGVYAFRPALPLAMIDPGLSPYTGQAIWLEPHRRNMSRFSAAADATPASRFGDMAPAFLLYAMLPLLIVGLAFNAVTQERELGTLRMLHSVGVSGVRLMAGKLAALMLALSGVLLPSLLVGAWTLARSGQMDAEAWARAGLMVLAYALYYTVFAAIALLVSIRVQRSRQALFALVGLWVAFVLVVPRLGAAAADRLVSLPTTSEFWSEINRDYQEGFAGDGNLAARGRAFDAQLLQQYGVARIRDLPVGATALRRLHRDAYADRVHEVHFADLWQRYDRQQQIIAIAGLLSPTLAMRSLSMRLSGTDLSHQQDFEAHAETYRRDLSRHIDEWDSASTRGEMSYDDKYGNNALWQSISPFAYAAPDVGFVLRSARLDMAVLLLWLVAALGLLGLSARRLQP